MILRTLTVRNYGPFYGEHSFELGPSEPRTSRPICLFGALNGGGKTSFVDAVLMSLYGKRARCSKREKRSWPEFLRACINERVSPEDGASVSLEFEYATAKGVTTLKVRRTWWVPGKGVSERLEVWRDGEPDPTLQEAWDQHIEALLPLGLSNLFVFDGELIRDEALADEPSPEVRGAFETLLGLELPRQLASDLQILIARQQKQLADAPALSQFEAMETELTTLRDERSNLKKDVGEWEVKLRHRKADLQRARDAFQAEGGDIARQRSRYERDRAQAHRHLGECRAQLRSLAEGVVPLAMVSGLLERAATRARREVDHGITHDSLLMLDQRDASLVAFLQKQGLDEVAVRAAQGFLQRDREERAAPLDPRPYLRVSAEVAGRLRSLAEGEVGKARQSAEKLYDAVLASVHDINHIDRLLQRSAPPEDVKKLLKRVEAAARAVHDLESRIQGHEERIAELTIQIDELARNMTAKLQKVTDSGHQSVEQRRTIRAAEKVIGIMGAYGDRLKARKLGELEQLVAQRFKHLAHKAHLVERVELDEQTFALRMLDQENQSIPRERLSAGEQQMMAVALLWGLAEASGRSLPVIIDTPLARLDGSHRMNLVRRYFPNASHQVIILSTDEEVHERYYKQLHQMNAVDREYLIEHDPRKRAASVREGYFWSHA